MAAAGSAGDASSPAMGVVEWVLREVLDEVCAGVWTPGGMGIVPPYGLRRAVQELAPEGAESAVRQAITDAIGQPLGLIDHWEHQPGRTQEDVEALLHKAIEAEVATMDDSMSLSGIRERIEGKRVVSVSEDGDTLTLDDSTTLTLYESASDCCAGAQGTWVIRPDALEAIITDVQVVPNDGRSGYDGDGTTNWATVKILHNQNPAALADCSANDGNGGYYFSVLSLRVCVPGRAPVETDVLSA